MLPSGDRSGWAIRSGGGGKGAAPSRSPEGDGRDDAQKGIVPECWSEVQSAPRPAICARGRCLRMHGTHAPPVPHREAFGLSDDGQRLETNGLADTSRGIPRPQRPAVGASRAEVARVRMSPGVGQGAWHRACLWPRTVVLVAGLDRQPASGARSSERTGRCPARHRP